MRQPFSSISNTVVTADAYLVHGNRQHNIMHTVAPVTGIFSAVADLGLETGPLVNHAAGDLGSCVPGRLRGKIIRIAVDDYGFANDILHPEAICSYCHLCAALLRHQWRQITSVPGMVATSGIIMVARLWKACTGAAVSLMNVETEEAAFTVFRKTGDIRLHPHTARFLIKPNLTTYIQCVRSAPDIRHRIRAAEASMHKITSLQLMPECGRL